VVTLILFAVVAAAVVIPTLHKGTTTRQMVGVVAGRPALDAELQKLAKAVGLHVGLVREPDLSAARAALSAGHLNMVVDGDGSILVENPISDSDSSTGGPSERSRPSPGPA
jgi:hypothetical protein